MCGHHVTIGRRREQEIKGALSPLSSPRLSRSAGVLHKQRQYPLAALIVAYTMLSLWILTQPIVGTGSMK
jgi:hypothetical protein